MSSAATIAALTAINASNNASGGYQTTTIVAFYIVLWAISLIVWAILATKYLMNEENKKLKWFLDYVFFSGLGGLFSFVQIAFTIIAILAFLIMFVEKLIS